MQRATTQHKHAAQNENLRFHACELAYDFTREEYARLHEDSSATVFQHPLWLGHFQQRIAPGRSAQMLAVTERDTNGRLLALLPLTLRQTGGLRLLELADLGVCDYCAPVVANNHEPDWNALRGALPSHDVLRIRNIRPEHAVALSSLAGQSARAAGYNAHATQLATSMNEWRQRALSASFDKYLARRVRKVRANEGSRLERIDDASQAEAAIHQLARLRHGRFDGDMIARQDVLTFYAEVARDGASSGFARTYRLSIDGVTAGVVFGVCHAGRYHYLLIGCDYERFGALSPGLVLYDFAIADWIEAGGTVFDFTIGDEPFKMDFGTCPSQMAQIEKAQSLTGRLGLLAKDMRERFRSGGVA
jgi:CelD/BcsL family acetyltransferase involved in cellulose biosynthesis